MTINDIKGRIRNLLLDTTSGSYRWSDSEIEGNITDAIRMVRSLRPETRYDSDGNLRDALTETGTILLDDRFSEAVTYYAVHKCYLKDDSDTANENAVARYYELFARTVNV